MPKQVFIGSSTQSLPVARAIQDELNMSTQYQAILWNQNVIGPGRYTIPGLVERISRMDFAIFVFSPDDTICYQNDPEDQRAKRTAFVPRDNVICECGMAIGLLGQQRCYIFQDRRATVPSDFRGLTTARYTFDPDYTILRARIASCVTAFMYIASVGQGTVPRPTSQGRGNAAFDLLTRHNEILDAAPRGRKSAGCFYPRRR